MSTTSSHPSGGEPSTFMLAVSSNERIVTKKMEL
jgi:hypothetical protein